MEVDKEKRVTITLTTDVLEKLKEIQTVNGRSRGVVIDQLIRHKYNMEDKFLMDWLDDDPEVPAGYKKDLKPPKTRGKKRGTLKIDELILDYIKKHPESDSKKIARAINITNASVLDHFQKMGKLREVSEEERRS